MADRAALSELAKLALRAIGKEHRPVFVAPDGLAHVAGHAAVALTSVTGRTPLITPAAARIAALGLAM